MSNGRVSCAHVLLLGGRVDLQQPGERLPHRAGAARVIAQVVELGEAAAEGLVVIEDQLGHIGHDGRVPKTPSGTPDLSGTTDPGPVGTYGGWNNAGVPGCAPTTTFRLPLTGLIGVFALAVCTTPLAFAAPGLPALYLVPAGIAVWLLRTRTVAGADAVVVHRLLGSRRLPWSDVDRLRVQERAWVRAVLGGGEEISLPAVRARDLPLLAAVSGGRIDDPIAAPQRPEPG